MDKNELYHSERYLGQEFSDELYHWKYLSRKRKNGRWVYTYKNQDYAKAKSKLDKANNDNTRATLNYAIAKANVDKNLGNWSKNVEGKIPDYALKSYTERSLIRDASFKKYKEAGKNFVNAKSNYLKTSIKTLPSRIIGNGAAAVANMVSKIGSAISNHVVFKPATLKTIKEPGKKKKTYFTLPKLKFK